MATLTRRNVRATYLSTDGKRLRGKVTFTPSVTLYDEGNNIVLLPRPIDAFPDDDGLVSVDLPITDDAAHNPTDWHYVVVEDFENGPSRQRYWIQVPAGSGPVELADQIVDEDPPKPFVKLMPGPQGDAGTTTLGTVNVRNPNQDPTITNTGTAQNAVFNFGLPRAVQVALNSTTVVDADVNPSVAVSTSVSGDKTLTFSLPQAKDVEVGTVTPVNPDQSPTVTDSGDENTSTLDFDLPRAPTFAVGTVTTGASGSSASVTDVGTDGDIELDFSIPQGEQGIQGIQGDQGIQGIQGPAGADGDGTAYYGQMSTQTQQTVNITTQGAYVPMAITGTFDSGSSYGTVAPTTATFGIKNDSGETQLFAVIATTDVQIGNNKTAGLRLAINGAGITETTCIAVTGNQNLAKLMTQWFVELDDGDEVSMLLADISGTDDIDVDRAKIVAFTPGRQGPKGDQGDPGVVPIGLVVALGG